jgi:hypothetical protein
LFESAGSDYRQEYVKLEYGPAVCGPILGNPHAASVFEQMPPQTAAYHNWPLIGSDTSILKNFPKLI